MGVPSVLRQAKTFSGGRRNEIFSRKRKKRQEEIGNEGITGCSGIASEERKVPKIRE